MVAVVEPAVALTRSPHARGSGRDPVVDLWVAPEDWAEAFAAVDPGTPHNEARGEVWEALATLLVDRCDADVPPEQLRRALTQDEALVDAFGGAWPSRRGRAGRRPVVGAGVPAPGCAPWLAPDEVRRLQSVTRRRGRRPTCRCSTPPGSGSATRTRRGGGAARRAELAAQREGDGARRRPPGRDRRPGDDGDVDAAPEDLGASWRTPQVGDPDLLAGPFRPRRRRRGPGADRTRSRCCPALPVAQRHGRRRPGAGPGTGSRSRGASGCSGVGFDEVREATPRSTTGRRRR